VVRLRRLPVSGSSAHVRAPGPLIMVVRRRVCPATVNVCPGGVARAACSRAAAWRR
jgi:hypothetical protein